MFKKTDIIFSLITGEIVALYFLNLFGEEKLTGFIPMVLPYLPMVFPILTVFCLWLAFLIGKKFLFVFQLAKFLLVGALATIFDLGALSFFIRFFEATTGIYFSFFKGITFIIATIAKYFIDKFWAFEKKETAEIKKEFAQFFVVTLVGLVINVGIASLMVNVVGPKAGFSKEAWANIAGIIAVLPTFAWNFIGYKFIVFKK